MFSGDGAGSRKTIPGAGPASKQDRAKTLFLKIIILTNCNIPDLLQGNSSRQDREPAS